MLNVNSAIYSRQGIDVNNVNKIASQIVKEASNNQPTVQAIDYSKFNRATLGIDLYSSRTSADLQKQIAMTQAGLYAQAVDVAKSIVKVTSVFFGRETTVEVDFADVDKVNK